MARAPWHAAADGNAAAERRVETRRECAMYRRNERTTTAGRAKTGVTTGIFRRLADRRDVVSAAGNGCSGDFAKGIAKYRVSLLF